MTLRGRAGALMLTVSQNRPPEETPPAAARDLAGRYERLRAAAWSAGLFARLRVSVVPEDGGTGAELSPDPLLLSLPRPEARIRLRLEMVDAREAPVVPKALGVRLSGTGSDGARVEGMTRNAATGRWELVDPLVRTDVSIVVPASDALERALYAEAGAGTPSPLVVVASAVLRDAPGQTLDAPGAVSDARLRLVAWEPCLTTFVVAAPTGDEAGREDHGSVPTSAAHFEAWRRVLRAARVRAAGEEYDAGDIVLSGWKIEDLTPLPPGSAMPEPLPPDALQGFAVRPGFAREAPLSFAGPGSAPIFVRFDALASLDAEGKKTVVERFFRLADWSVTLHDVNTDPASFRMPVPVGPNAVASPVLGPGSGAKPVWGASSGPTAWLAIPAARGSRELRATARLTGRVSAAEAERTLSVSGAIRFVLVGADDPLPSRPAWAGFYRGR